MKIPPTLRRSDTASRLEAARAALAGAQGALTRLSADRERALLDADGESETIRGLDAQIAEQGRALRAAADKIRVLQQQLRTEDAEQREIAKQAAIDRVMIPLAEEIIAHADQAQRALLEAVDALEKLEAKHYRMRQSRPAAVPKPTNSDGLGQFRCVEYDLFGTNPGGTEGLRRLKSSAPGLAADVQQTVVRYIEECRKEPVPAPADDNLEQAA
jgi:hypothetical protein